MRQGWGANCTHLTERFSLQVLAGRGSEKGETRVRKITETCHLLHGSPRALQRLKIYAFKRYQDHRKYLEMERRYVEHSLTDRAAP